MSPLTPHHLLHLLPLFVAAAGLATLVLIHPRLSVTLLLLLVPLILLLAAFQLRRFLRRTFLLLPPLPPDVHSHILHHPLVQSLSDEDRKLLLRNCRFFLAEHTISGIPPLQVPPEARAILAVNATLLTLHLPYVEYPTTPELLIYPGPFNLDYEDDGDGHQGLFHEQGPIIFSLPDLLDSVPPRAENPALHEFVHALDFTSGSTDGLPPTFPHSWERLLQQYARDPRQNRRLARLLPDSAFENEAEFFAYLSEQFFERPHQLRGVAPALYNNLRSIYRQEPHLRFPPPPVDSE